MTVKLTSLMTLALVAGLVSPVQAQDYDSDQESVISDSTRTRGDIVWSFTPYIWALDTGLDVRADGEATGGGTIFKTSLTKEDEDRLRAALTSQQEN